MLRELCTVAVIGLICGLAVVGCSHTVLMTIDARYAYAVRNYDKVIVPLQPVASHRLVTH